MSDETLKLPGLPEKALLGAEVAGHVAEFYGHTDEAMRELQRQTVEFCANALRDKMKECSFSPADRAFFADYLRSFLKDQP